MALNVYHTKYHFYCEHCVCKYCAAIRCPAGKRTFKRDYSFCARSSERGACPRYDCDFFRNRNITPRKYIVVNRRKKEAPAIKALNELAEKIEKLEKTLWDKNTDHQTK